MHRLLHLLVPWRHRAVPPAPGAEAAPPRGRPGDAGPCCGWFDSSHELKTGLLVREHEPQQAQWTAQGIIAISSN